MRYDSSIGSRIGSAMSRGISTIMRPSTARHQLKENNIKDSTIMRKGSINHIGICDDTTHKQLNKKYNISNDSVLYTINSIINDIDKHITDSDDINEIHYLSAYLDEYKLKLRDELKELFDKETRNMDYSEKKEYKNNFKIKLSKICGQHIIDILDNLEKKQSGGGVINELKNLQLGGKRMKRSAKKHSAKKRSAKKRSAKKHSAKKHSAKKHSAKKHSAKKRSAKKRSVKKRSAKKLVAIKSQQKRRTKLKSPIKKW